jgi:hypothetical protein
MSTFNDAGQIVEKQLAMLPMLDTTLSRHPLHSYLAM